MATCKNGHENPRGRNFCGECGVQIAREQLLLCPRGHVNAAGLNFCGDCGAPVGTTAIPASMNSAVAPAVDAGAGDRNDGESWYQNALQLAGGYPQAIANTKRSAIPGKLPAPEHFRLDVVVVEQQCFGSAGCRVVYTLKPTYTGPGSLKGTSFTVVYQISGGEQPQVGHFTVTDGTAAVDHETTINTPSPESILTATATQILPHDPNSYSYSVSL